jgi:putative ABC transport system substrate-binding protein
VPPLHGQTPRGRVTWQSKSDGAISLRCLAARPRGRSQRAQQARLRKIGVLWHAASAEEEAVYLGALREGLAELGYVEGRDIVLENRFPAEQWERFISLAAELAQLKPDLLVAVSRPAAMAAQRATTTIPIVFSAVPDPVGDKLVESLARPGKNITGLSNMALDLSAKRIELLRDMVPAFPRGSESRSLVDGDLF